MLSQNRQVMKRGFQVGSFAGFGIIVICQTMEVFIFPDIFTDVPMKMYAAVTLLPILGLTLGYVAAFAFKLRPMIRRTVAIECGIQNVGTALAIVSLSYPYHVSNDTTFPGHILFHLIRDMDLFHCLSVHAETIDQEAGKGDFVRQRKRADVERHLMRHNPDH